MAARELRSFALVGLRGSGKSTLARRLARRLRLPCVDMDHLLEEQAGRAIADWVAEAGWGPFRKAEEQLLRDLAEGPRAVVSTGGGVVTSSRSRLLLRRSFLTIYLHWPAETLARRIRRDPYRPPLKEGLTLEQEMQALHRERDPLYRRAARYTVENAPGDKPKDTLEKLLHLLGTPG